MRKQLSEKLEHGRIISGEYASRPFSGPMGAFHIVGPFGAVLHILSNHACRTSGYWEHVSVSTDERIPYWQEMCLIKELFWEDEETVFQLHPPKSRWINNHPRCLHLWRHATKRVPMPPDILVGYKELDNDDNG
jgi:hypothetical protein